MISLIRTSFKLVLLVFLSLAVFSCFAGTGSLKPANPATFQIRHIEQVDSFLNVGVTKLSSKDVSAIPADAVSKSASRICSCQILNLESSNYDHRYVVLLAEKTNDGTSMAFKAAKSRILKEKKHLKELFYDKVKVVSEIQGTGSCKSMFYQLSSADSSLKLYEILNADIQ